MKQPTRQEPPVRRRAPEQPPHRDEVTPSNVRSTTTEPEATKTTIISDWASL